MTTSTHSLEFEPTLTRSQRAYLSQAVRLAKKSQMLQRHGAIVVKSGSVISSGVNSYSNDPRMFPVDYLSADKLPHEERGQLISVHAEIAALRRASKDQLKGAVLYVARVSKSGEPAYSAPCEQCAKALREAGIKRVIFT